jgi:hypothetical protein
MTASSAGGHGRVGAQPLAPATDQRTIAWEPRVTVACRRAVAKGPWRRCVDGGRLRTTLERRDLAAVNVTDVSESVLGIGVVLLVTRADRRQKQATLRPDAVDRDGQDHRRVGRDDGLAAAGGPSAAVRRLLVGRRRAAAARGVASSPASSSSSCDLRARTASAAACWIDSSAPRVRTEPPPVLARMRRQSTAMVSRCTKPAVTRAVTPDASRLSRSTGWRTRNSASVVSLVERPPRSSTPARRGGRAGRARGPSRRPRRWRGANARAARRDRSLAPRARRPLSRPCRKARATRASRWPLRWQGRGGQPARALRDQRGGAAAGCGWGGGGAGGVVAQVGEDQPFGVCARLR